MKLSIIFKYLFPQSKIGGLEINDECLRYVLLIEKNKFPVIITINLPPGTIVGGKIQNIQNFETALKELNSRIKKEIKFKKNELIELIITLPSSAVFISDFELPPIKDKNLNEAIYLNLKIASPIPIESTYYNWEKLTSAYPPFQTNIISTFIDKTIPDSIDESLKKCGFIATAIEFSGLSILRATGKYYPSLATKPHIISMIGKSGINMIISRNSNVLFNYFYEWQEEEKNNLDTQSIAKILKIETQKIINYYYAHFLSKNTVTEQSQEDASTAIPATNSESYLDIILLGEKIDIKTLISISEILKKEIPNKILIPIKNSDYISPMGAAMRGLIPRFSDTGISLMGVNLTEKYKLQQIDLLINFWGKISTFCLAFFAILFIAIDLFLISPQKDKMTNFNSYSSSPKDQELISKAISLMQEVNQKNNLIDLAIQANNLTPNYSQLLSSLTSIAKIWTVDILNITTNGINQPISIIGSASNKDIILKFKENLLKKEYIEKVELPIQSLTEIERKTQFKMTIHLKNLP